MVRAKLPSRMVDKDGSIMPQAVAYSKISREDMRKSVEYQIECIKRKKLGQRAPRPPESVSGLASSFFTDQKIANQTIQHSQVAANRNKQEVYAAHANNGKAHIWLTISPDDAKASCGCLLSYVDCFDGSRGSHSTCQCNAITFPMTMPTQQRYISNAFLILLLKTSLAGVRRKEKHTSAGVFFSGRKIAKKGHFAPTPCKQLFFKKKM